MSRNEWFTSDPHFYHANVIKYCSRPYDSVERMNEQLIANWNSVVAPDDTVYCLGDVALAARAVEVITSRLNGYKVLVLGNHDFPHPAHPKGKSEANRAKWENLYSTWGWDVVVSELGINLGPEWALAYHVPYGPDTWEHAERIPKWAKYVLPDRKKLLLCGHVHEKWKHKYTPGGTLMVNVGVDVWDYRPISSHELNRYIQEIRANGT